MNKLFWLFIAFLPFYSCTIEPLTADLVEEPSIKNEPLIVPCSYDDVVKLGSPLNVNDNVRLDFRDHFDYEEVRMSYYNKPYIPVVEYYSKYGFKEVTTDKVFNLANNSKVRMQLISYDFNSFTYNATEGNIYLIRQPNGDLKVDWCDVKFKDYNNKLITCEGGFTLVK